MSCRKLLELWIITGSSFCVLRREYYVLQTENGILGNGAGELINRHTGDEFFEQFCPVLHSLIVPSIECNLGIELCKCLERRQLPGMILFSLLQDYDCMDWRISCVADL